MNEHNTISMPPSSPSNNTPDSHNKNTVADALRDAMVARDKFIKSLEALRTLPSHKVFSSGKTRDEMIEAIENQLEQINETIEQYNLVGVEPEPPLEIIVSHDVASQQQRILSHKPANSREPIEEPERQINGRGLYITLGGVCIPVCEEPRDSAQWNAVPGATHVSGGKKFTEVRFLKDTSFLTHSAKPGELMRFSEKHRKERLMAVDTVLEGYHELQLFNELLAHLSELVNQYESLNPDMDTYDAEAYRISSAISHLTQAEGIKERVVHMNQECEDEFAERVAKIFSTQQFLRTINEGSDSLVPPLDPHFKLTDFFEKTIAEFAGLVNRQLGLGNNAHLEAMAQNQQTPDWDRLPAKGLTTIVGPRGTGKNKLAEYYCARTNRPLFRYACSPDKEERDLTYDVELSDGEIVKVPTRILIAITTPNAMLELDELNLLRPNVAKFFNSLFDSDRAVFLNDQVVKAARGVIFVGLMNPADYDGVEDLPETIDDRGQPMAMGYPPFKIMDASLGAEVFTCDEALILKENIYPIKDIRDDDFEVMWDSVVNKKGSASGIDAKTVRIIKDLKNIITIADKSRLTVEAYKTRSSDIKMVRDISLRGTIDAARFYSENHLWEADLSKLPGIKAGWNAAQYAVAMSYMPHTFTYKRGRGDKDTMLKILTDKIT